jgi:hypothetical protein
MRLPIIVVPTCLLCAECGHLLAQHSEPNVIRGTLIVECQNQRCKRFSQQLEVPLQTVYCKRVG